MLIGENNRPPSVGFIARRGASMEICHMIRLGRLYPGILAAHDKAYIIWQVRQILAKHPDLRKGKVHSEKERPGWPGRHKEKEQT